MFSCFWNADGSQDLISAFLQDTMRFIPLGHYKLYKKRHDALLLLNCLFFKCFKATASWEVQLEQHWHVCAESSERLYYPQLE